METVLTASVLQIVNVMVNTADHDLKPYSGASDLSLYYLPRCLFGPKILLQGH